MTGFDDDRKKIPAIADNSLHQRALHDGQQWSFHPAVAAVHLSLFGVIMREKFWRIIDSGRKVTRNINLTVYMVAVRAPTYIDSCPSADTRLFHNIRSGLDRPLTPEPQSLRQSRSCKMRFAILALALAATTTAQFPVAEEVLWPTNNWTVREAYSSVSDAKAEVGFSVTMHLPFNNTLPALHQTCGRSWDRKAVPTVPTDWATCEIDEKVAWRFQPGVQHDFPKKFTLQILFWDRKG